MSEKASGYAAWIFLALILKLSEKTVFEQKFGFYCFFDFLDRIFF